MKTIAIESDEQWHELRRQHVGGSEIAALFGEHPQISRYELWQRKAGRITEPDLSDNERVLWGQLLEPAIAEGVARKTKWHINKVRRYHSMLPGIGLGGSLDYEVTAHERGPGVLEIKTADWLVARAWENGEPPLSYELQVQAYLFCTGRKWGCMAVLIGGNELRLFEYEARPRTHDIIATEVAAFWQSIRDNKPPAPDYATDGATIGRLYSSVAEGKVVDLTGNNRLPELIANYQRGLALEKEGGAIKEAAKAETLTIIGDAERAICGAATISAKTVEAAHVEFYRKAYRGFRITEKKVKADA